MQKVLSRRFIINLYFLEFAFIYGEEDNKVIFSKRVLLKDGRECEIRSGEARDGEAALDLFKQCHSESPYLLSYPEEITYTVKDESEYLEAKKNNAREVALLAFVDGKVVGSASFDSISSLYKLRHRADFGISIIKDYTHLGLGRIMSELLIELAKEAGYTSLDLEVFASNENAIKLYKSLGFIEYGRHKRGFRSKENGYEEMILMSLDLV